MLPEAKGDNLLYVTNYSDVLVFSYPQGKLVGALKGFYSAAGECVDSAGDVFITNYKPVTVYEYAHGGTKPIAQFPTKKAGTFGCAINPVNGDLAITGQTSYVEVYRGAKAGKPVVLRDKGMFFGQFCTYDTRGNFFFDGENPQEKARISELPATGHKFVALQFHLRIDELASIQWDGRFLTALAYVPYGYGKPEIVQFKVKGTRADRVGKTPLGSPAHLIVQYFITNGSVAVPNLDATTGQSSAVLLYNYRAGGKPYGTFTKRITDARGVAVSYANPT